MDTELLLDKYAVDTAHAHQVASQALVLFDALKPLHGLARSQRRLLQSGALLHNVGLTINEAEHHTVGRDIVLDDSALQCETSDRAMLACLVAFHRKKVRPETEPAFLCLRKKDQRTVLLLAGLLRIADGLDYSGTQTTRVADYNIDDKRVTLKVVGPHSAEDAERAQKKADLWAKVVGRPLQVITVPDTAQLAAATTDIDENVAQATQPAENGQHTPPSTEADDTNGSTDALTEVGRRLLRSSFQLLLAHEPIARKGKEIEGVHQMRVNTRRLRALLQILRPIAPEREVQLFRKELQKLARALSPVRDCDVLLEQMATFQASLPAEQQADVQLLTDALRRKRAQDQAAMLAYLDSNRYETFKRDFATFMNADTSGWDGSVRVRDLTGSMIWRYYEELRAHEVHIDVSHGVTPEAEAALHEARISGKRLRYVLELFNNILGPQTDRTLKPLKQLQDYLGALQDIVVAVALMQELPLGPEASPILTTYVASREAERTDLLAQLPQQWNRMLSLTYRRNLAQLMVGL